MKRMKKFLAVLLAAIMVMSLGTSVFADESSTTTTNVTDSSFTIKVTGVASANHSMSAYQIFSGTLAKQTTTDSESNTTETYILSDIDWGNGIDSSKINSSQTINSTGYASIYAALASISYTTTTGTESTTVYPFTSDKNVYSSESDNLLSTAAAVADALDAYDDDSDVVNQFAEIISYYLSSTSTSSLTTNGSESPYTYSGTVSSAGYYLIKDSINSESTATDDAVSDYILKVVADAEVKTKAEVPSVTKTVTDNDETEAKTYNNAAEGESVSFTITATVPDISDYTNGYSLTISDTLSNGLTFDTTNGTVSVSISATDTSGTATTLTPIEKTNYTLTTTASSIKIEFSNLYQYLTTSSVDVSKGASITVTYSATVSSSATYGNEGNKNSVSLTYSNDPTSSSSMGTSTTVETYTYTTKLTVTKVDEEDSALYGAGFTLYKAVSVDSWDESTTYYSYENGEIKAVDKETTTTPTSGTTYYVVVDTNTDSSSNNNSFVFDGLDDGTYVLVESKTPDGYNTSSAIQFAIKYVKDTGWQFLTDSGTAATSDTGVTLSEGVFSAKIVNYAGTTLPTTGGIGTTIFYVVGAILVLGAAVILVTRRRMANR